MNLNKVIIAGRLTRDPEGKVLPAGTAITNLSIATNRTWTQDGEKREEAEFHNVVVFGRQGETCAQFLHKGDTALVEGRIQTRSWESDGVTRYRTEIVADRVHFGPRGGEGDREERSDEAPAKPAEEAKPIGGGFDYPEETIDPDDIPF